MLNWKNNNGFRGPDHYIAVERSICEALWSEQAVIYIEPKFRRSELSWCLLPYSPLYLVDIESYAVWRLIQPTERSSGSFMHMGLARRRQGTFYPIYPEESRFKLSTFVDIFDEHYKTDLDTRLENASDSPPTEYE